MLLATAYKYYKPVVCVMLLSGFLSVGKADTFPTKKVIPIAATPIIARLLSSTGYLFRINISRLGVPLFPEYKCGAAPKAITDKLIEQQYEYMRDLIGRTTPTGTKDVQIVANLCGMTIVPRGNATHSQVSHLNLSYADFSGVTAPSLGFWYVTLSDANFENADIQHISFFHVTADRQRFKSTTESVGVSFIDFSGANMRGANISLSNMRGSQFLNANLAHATMSSSDFANADFRGAVLTNAKFVDCDLSGAKFSGANVSGLVYEPNHGAIPNVADMAAASNLYRLTYERTAAPLRELRAAFQRAGYNEGARAITYAIKETQIRKGLVSESVWQRVKAGFAWVLFGWPSAWGYRPLRPLWLILMIMAACIPAYYFAIRSGRVVRLAGNSSFRAAFGETPPLGTSTATALRYAPYVSLLSAFNIGWRGLDPSAWIRRLQPTDSRIVTRGWARVVAGAQSLFTLFMVITFLFVYFGGGF